MASIVVFYGGAPIHKRAFSGLKPCAPGMETLISTGYLTAYIYSLFQFFSGSIHLYFDTAAMLILLVLSGKMLERSAVIEESSVMGEAKPVKVSVRDKVKSGTRLMSGLIKLNALHVGPNSILGKMITLMEESLASGTA
jgi:cation transport ATPase